MPVPLSPDSIALIAAAYGYGKVVLGFGAGAVAIYKAVNWVKEIRTKDFVELRSDVQQTNLTIERLGAKVDIQTSAVVRELQELRSDFRTFYASVPQQMAPARSKSKRLQPKVVVKKA